MQNKSKEQIKTEQQVFHNLLRIVETFPQYTLSQHLNHILRKKDSKIESYFWHNDTLLKRIEDYYDELNVELLNNFDEEED